MDSLTHLVLGACVGEIIAEKRIGKKAWLFGALAQSLPDIDFVASFFLTPSANLLAHRGFTHSLLFVLLSSYLLAYVCRHWMRMTSMNIHQWAFFWAVQSLVHIFLDTFNNYGVGWLEPFSHARFSFNILFVLDPFFTMSVLVPAIAFVFLRNRIKRRKWAIAGLSIAGLYLAYAVFNKQLIHAAVKKNLSAHNISTDHFFTTPTPLNTWLWFIVAEDRDGFHIGHRSVFDRTDSIDLYFVPRQDSLIATLPESDEDIRRLVRFSKGYYSLEKWSDSLIFNDLRFGQIQGWRYPKGRFVFHYFLHAPAENEMVVQRGRFENWNEDEIKALIRRIRGK
jgi:inner membrane protein